MNRQAYQTSTGAGMRASQISESNMTATQAQAEDRRSVIQDLDAELTAAEGLLHGAIDRLFEKLERALMPEFLSWVGADPVSIPPRPAISPLADNLRNHIEIVDGATMRLQLIIDRQQIG